MSEAMNRYAHPESPAGAGVVLDLASDYLPELNRAFTDLRQAHGWRYETKRGYSLNGPDHRAFRWKVAIDQLEEAFSEAESIAKRSELLNERVSVQIWWEFNWKNPQTGKLLPFQDNWPEIDFRRPRFSVVQLNLSATAKVDLWLLFPFSSVDEECQTYIRGLQAHLPLTFSDKHWRLFNLDTSGKWRPRKCDPLRAH